MKTADTELDRGHFLSCDWGTTSFRLRLARVDDKGDPETERTGLSDSDGITHTFNAWKRQQDSDEPGNRQVQAQGGVNNQQARQNFFKRTLLDKISALQKLSGVDLDSLPIILSGMASSSIGLKELPYSPLPLDLDKPDLQFEILNESDTFPHKLILVSGVSGTRDVMRGEEIQLLGIAGNSDLQSGTCILPGTHSKHLTIRERVLTGFSTWMTGELFELISTRSILANSITTPGRDKQAIQGPETISDSFLEGVQLSTGSHLLHTLFEIRAGDLLYQTKKQNNYDYLSGLLIGTELKTLSERASEKIIIGGGQALRSRYAAACRFFNLDVHEITNSDLTIQGQRRFLNHLKRNNTQLS